MLLGRLESICPRSRGSQGSAARTWALPKRTARVRVRNTLARFLRKQTRFMAGILTKLRLFATPSLSPSLVFRRIAVDGRSARCGVSQTSSAMVDQGPRLRGNNAVGADQERITRSHPASGSKSGAQVVRLPEALLIGDARGRQEGEGRWSGRNRRSRPQLRGASGGVEADRRVSRDDAGRRHGDFRLILSGPWGCGTELEVRVRSRSPAPCHCETTGTGRRHRTERRIKYQRLLESRAEIRVGDAGHAAQHHGEGWTGSPKVPSARSAQGGFWIAKKDRFHRDRGHILPPPRFSTGPEFRAWSTTPPAVGPWFHPPASGRCCRLCDGRTKFQDNPYPSTAPSRAGSFRGSEGGSGNPDEEIVSAVRGVDTTPVGPRARSILEAAAHPEVTVLQGNHRVDVAIGAGVGPAGFCVERGIEGSIPCRKQATPRNRVWPPDVSASANWTPPMRSRPSGPTHLQWWVSHKN